MTIEIPTNMQTWSIDQLVLQDEFRALMEAKDRIVQQRGPRDRGYAYVTDREPGGFGCWILGFPTESLRADEYVPVFSECVKTCPYQTAIVSPRWIDLEHGWWTPISAFD